MPSTRLPLFLAVLSAIPLFASDRLFLFHGDSTSAAVFDARGLARTGTAIVPRGAFTALRAGANIYVVAPDRVTVFDDDLRPLADLPLGDDAATAAAVDPVSEHLLVAAGSRLYRIDTRTNRIASELEVGSPASALRVQPSGRLAYWMAAGSRQVRIIDLEANRVLPGTADLAAVPNAFAGSFMAAGPQVFSAAPSQAGAAGRSHHPDGPAVLLAATDSGVRLLRSDKALLHVSADGGAVTALAPPASDDASLKLAALSPAGDAAYLALDDGRILALDPKDETAAAMAWTSPSPTALAFVPGPSQGGANITLIKVSGDEQSVIEGDTFNIVVRAEFVGGIEMTVSSNSPSAVCEDPPLLLGGTNVTVPCKANAVEDVTTATLTVRAPLLDLTAVFTIFVVPAGLPDGLFIVSGNNQTVGAGAAFALVVESRLNGLPRAAAPIGVTETSSVITCPSSGLTTNASGRATINCTVSGSVAVSETATISVSDPANVVAFTVNVQGQGGANDALVRVTPDPVTVFEGQGFGLTVRAQLNGSPQPNVPLTVTENSAAIQCPTSGTTGGNGEAIFVCGANLVAADVTAPVTISDSVHSVVFTVTVKNATVTNGFQKVSGDNQIVPRNTQFPLPLVVRAVTNGEPDANLLLAVTVSNAAVTCPVSTLTDGNGMASVTCSAGTVASATDVTINVKDAADRTLAEPFRATVSPNQGGNATAIIVLSGANLAAQAGETLTDAIQVRVENSAGEVVPGASIYTSGPEGVTLSPAVGQSGPAGLASFDVSFACPPAIGQIRLGLSATSAEATVNYTRATGPLHQLLKDQGDNQVGVPGERLPLALRVKSTDQCGAVLSNVPVTWSVVPPEAATLESVSSITNSLGLASALVRPSNRGGAYQVRAVATQNPSIAATFALVSQNAATQLQIVSGNEQSVPAGGQASLPLIVRALSAINQPVQGVSVSFQVISGSGSVPANPVLTDAQGRASVNFTAGQVRGPVNVRATGAGLNVTFLLTVTGGVPQLQLPGFVNAASFQPGFVAGSTGTIFGVNLTDGLTGAVNAPYTPGVGFPTEFRGVRVTVGGIPAPILSLANINGQEQINIQVPFELAQGTVTVVVRSGGAQASISGVPIFSAQPGIFEYYLGPDRYAAVLHANFDVVTPANPARPGEIVLLFLTGLGRVTPPVGTNQAGPSSPPATTVQQPTVTLGGVAQEVMGSYYAPQLHTVYQINFRVGAATQAGLRPLVVSVDGANSQQAVLPVAPAF